MTSTTASSRTEPEPTMTPWRVAPTSGFKVNGSTGSVPLIQIDRTRFLVTATFEFDDEATVEDLVARMVVDGMNEADARAAVDNARTYVPSEEEPTDLASIPSFMRWFANPYGVHTLAAIIHDRLIVNTANEGALHSDALADRFFRHMMRSAGVPWLKRWIMWAAVALRSRFAAGGWRRAAIVAWLLLAVTGISASVSALGTAIFGWPSLASPAQLAVFAFILPVASAPLWGRQYAASAIAAFAALWILPAAVFGLVGFGVYSVLESLTQRLGIS